MNTLPAFTSLDNVVSRLRLHDKCPPT